MNEETILSWNVVNWITVVLMVAIAWWVLVGAFKLYDQLNPQAKNP